MASSTTAPEVVVPAADVKIPLVHKLAVGAVAGIIGTAAIFPIDVVKTRLQNQKPDRLGRLRYNGAVHAFRSIIKREGFSGLYRGLGANLVGVSPEKAIKLTANDTIREYFMDRNAGKPIELWQELAAGCGAGFVQVVATNPMEIVKIRLQLQGADPTAVRMSPMEVVRSLGIRGLYKGTVSTLMRDVPFSAVFFPLYSNLKRIFGGADPGMLPTLAAGCVSGAVASGACTPADVIKTRLQVIGGMTKYGGIVGCFKSVVEKEGVGALFKGIVPRMMVVAPLFGISLVAFELQKSIMKDRLSKHADRL